MEMIERCFLCGMNLVGSATRNAMTEVYTLQCRRCGEYAITAEAASDLKGDHPYLRAAARQEYEAGRQLMITSENWQILEEEHSHTGVFENREKLLNHILRRSRRPGGTVDYDLALDYSVIDAENQVEFRWHLDALEKADLIERPGGGIHRQLTEQGWNYLMGPAGGGAIHGRCFVAMSFAEEHAAIYTEGIKPAVTDAGYSAVQL